MAVLLDTEVDVDCTAHCDHGLQVPRDKNGWPIIPKLGRCNRASNAGRELEDGYNLDLWHSRLTLLGASQRHAAGIRDRAVVLDVDNDREELNDLAHQAREMVGQSAASDQGTALHAVLARVNLGLDLPTGLSHDTLASVDAYRRLVFDELKLTPVYVEQFVVNRERKMAGTFDVILSDGNRWWTGDLKTGRKAWERSYPGKTACQLAVYAGGTRWCPVAGWLDKPLVEPDVGLLITVPVGRAEAHVDGLDLARARDALDLAVRVKDWRKARPISRDWRPTDS